MCARGVCREAEKFKACMKGGCDGITDFIFIKKVSAVHVIENIWDDKMTKWFIQDEGKKNAIKKNIFKRKTRGFYFKREYWILRILSRIYAADHVDMAESRILRRAFCPSNNMWVDSVSMRQVMGKFIIIFFELHYILLSISADIKLERNNHFLYVIYQLQFSSDFVDCFIACYKTSGPSVANGWKRKGRIYMTIKNRVRGKATS